MLREKQEVEIFQRGEWIPITAIVDKSALCKGPGCRRKIPSKMSKCGYKQLLKGFPKKYHRVLCSKECYDEAVKAGVLKP